MAMAREMVHHRKPPFKALLGEVQEGLQELFGTTNEVITLAASGTGAMQAAVTNLFQPGETVLVVEGGKFGERWNGVCAAAGVKTIVFPVAWGGAADPEAVREVIDKNPEIRGVLLQISETSTGAMHPVRELAAVTRERDVMLVADGVSSISISPCPMDAWGIDCLLTGSQKGLMLPPGLSFIALSDRAWKLAESRQTRDYYFDLPQERRLCAKGQTAYTPAISLLYGLRESLALFREAGLESIYRKQWALTCLARTGIAALGFELLAKEHFTWGLTSLLLPAGIGSGPLLAHAAEHYGVIMASGMGYQTENVIRVGHMGWVDWADVTAGLHALAGSFTALGGHIGAENYLESALKAYENALAGPLPGV
ncbi:alanine--glyoxylate aminotransferase family protein [Desulfovibrio sp. OttesenSCG-928-I05]|nr:alanine--glyoxylate aminotransferase family protein [Desulfovibrio sp. OttesenSCG-928-I05]